ncbi:MAG: helix-turn-helix transcriptional regulator [Lachnospiraceae bacterium]|nr:helix-turn-helix transcriptional regulator [Lachnospiraceae bacterium]
MDQTNTTLYQSFQLLRNVLQSAFQVPTELFTPPYTDIKKIDQGLRAMIWTNYNDDSSKFSFADLSQEYRILIIKSNLGFYNVLALLGLGERPDFISVGPFRDEELSPNYFSQILRESHISPSDMQSLKHIYEQMPYAQPDTVTAVTKQILAAYLPEFKDVVPELIQYSEQKRAVDINTNLLEEYSVEHAEQYRNSLFSFLETLKSGDSPRAQKTLQTFLQEARFVHGKNMREYKWMLQSLNNYCHMELLTMGIHPFYIMKQMVSTRTKIETMTSIAKLEQMPSEICHKYCLLVKNYANPEYSRLTKDAIDYIQLHMEEELSLSHLAEHFEKNASALSHTFSKETGMSLTKFIHQTRIREAIRLFNTTNLSVSEVAVSVGYQDFSYFSKVFSQHTGYSPREYKKQGK